MTQLVRFQIHDHDDCDTGDVIVEVEPISDEGVLVAGGGTIEEATGTFTEKLASVRAAVAAALRELGDSLEPDVLKVNSVEVVDMAARVARVVVPDYQQSLAIGKEGQNARLAARLTGWRIDIRSDAEPETSVGEETAGSVDDAPPTG